MWSYLLGLVNGDGANYFEIISRDLELEVIRIYANLSFLMGLSLRPNRQALRCYGRASNLPIREIKFLSKLVLRSICFNINVF